MNIKRSNQKSTSSLNKHKSNGQNAQKSFVMTQHQIADDGKIFDLAPMGNGPTTVNHTLENTMSLQANPENHHMRGASSSNNPG